MKLGQIFPALVVALALATLTWALTAGETGQTRDADRDTEADTEADTETATFSMYCYWTGEATLGKVDGIVASRIGHWQGREIVQVDYDAAKTDVGEMVRALKGQNSFYALVTADAEKRDEALGVLDEDEVALLDGKPHFIESKHSLRVAQPKFYALDLTERQAIALNTWAHFGGPLPDVLTDEQLEQVGLRKR